MGQENGRGDVRSIDPTNVPRSYSPSFRWKKKLTSFRSFGQHRLHDGCFVGIGVHFGHMLAESLKFLERVVLGYFPLSFTVLLRFVRIFGIVVARGFGLVLQLLRLFINRLCRLFGRGNFTFLRARRFVRSYLSFRSLEGG